MSRSFRRHVRMALVWTAVLLLTVDTATACRIFGGRRASNNCYQPVSCGWESSCSEVKSCCEGKTEGTTSGKAPDAVPVAPETPMRQVPTPATPMEPPPPADVPLI